ncbi:MAG: hypothetical protein P1V36_06460 [Planctomycetota bacterium]|nr:hypothetical protein [Planctomycetota bacterium]
MEHDDQTGPGPDDAHEIAQQADVELSILLGIERTLRVALQWMTRGRGNSRKLSTLRFQMWTFKRHLTRLNVLSDHGGYLHVVTDAVSDLAGEVHVLRVKRTELHSDLNRTMLLMEHISQDDADGFARLCADLEGFLDHLRSQGERERALVRQALARNQGGAE